MHTKFLGPNELSNLLEMIHSLVMCRNNKCFDRISASFADFVGADGMIFGFPQEATTGETAVGDLNICYPREWVKYYQEREFWRIDPVVRAALTKEGPQHWKDIYQRFPPDKKFLKTACDFGLEDGFTCLSRSATGVHWILLSLSGDFSKNRQRTCCLLEYLTPHFHIALRSLKARNEAAKLDHLSRREQEVLKWLQNGKTSWEISIILRVSEATVNFHVKNIKAKLNVVNRSAAVAVAIHAGLINYG